MKVLISGAYATGKTTLFRKLQKKFASHPDFAAVPDLARRCPLPLNKEQSTTSSLWILGSEIAAEARACGEGGRLVLLDRGVPDILSHTLHLAKDDAYGIFLDLAQAWARTYAKVFWARVDPSLSIESDGARILDRDYQDEMESAITVAFEHLDVDPVELPPATEDRVALVSAVIEDNLS